MPRHSFETSEYDGVTFLAREGKYRARLRAGGRVHHCGAWLVERDAAVARDRAALHFGRDLVNEPRRARALGPASPEELCRLGRLDVRKRKVSPFFGVRYVEARDRWEAYVGRLGRKGIRIALFPTPHDAAVAHDRLALHLLGEAAQLNLPDYHLAPATLAELQRWAHELGRERLRLRKEERRLHAENRIRRRSRGAAGN